MQYKYNIFLYFSYFLLKLTMIINKNKRKSNKKQKKHTKKVKKKVKKK